jgi:hypothetical protein
VGDPAGIDFSVFLMDHGMVPYRVIMDNQMPGIYMVHWAVMHSIGAGDLAWRMFDLAVLAVAAAAMFAIARPYGWFAGAFGAGMFTLIHAHGGDEQMGQRDLIMAALLLAATAFLLAAFRRKALWPMLFFGLLAATAASIKPTAGAFLLGGAGIAAAWAWTEKRNPVTTVLLAIAGALLPLAAVLEFLSYHRATAAFLHTMRTVVPFYASMGRNTVVGMLTTSKTIPLMALFLLLGLAIQWLRREHTRQQAWEAGMLLFGIAFGLLHYFVQARGFPYHRYPFLAFLFCWLGIQLATGLRSPQRLVRGLACAGVLLGMASAAEFIVHAIRTPPWGKVYLAQLPKDLAEIQAAGGASLSGHVQCLEQGATCQVTLLRTGILQASGVMYDFLLFGDGGNPVIQQSRQQAWAAWQANPPKLFVVDPYLFWMLPCSARPDQTTYSTQYGKLATWPEFNQWLQQDYTLVRDFKIPEPDAPCKVTLGYRIYEHK